MKVTIITGNRHKKGISALLALVLALAMAVPVFAAVNDTGFSNVDASAWYAEAVRYCRQHNLMSGTGDNRFEPESDLTRAQFATVLYRIEKNPAVTGTDAFTDYDTATPCCGLPSGGLSTVTAVECSVPATL